MVIMRLMFFCASAHLLFIYGNVSGEVQGGVKVKQGKLFGRKIRSNVELIQSIMGESSDFTIRELILSSNKQIVLFFLNGMVDQKLVDQVISSLLEHTPKHNVTIQMLKDRIINIGEVNLDQSVEKSMDHILSGGLLLLLDGSDEGINIAIPGWEDRSITESTTQSVIRGPKDSFTETLGTNTTLVRRRIKDTRIRVTVLKIGSKTKTEIAIMYMDEIVDGKLTQQIIKRLRTMKTDRVLEGQYIEEILRENNRQTIFPMLYNSDRPDTIAAGIVEGRIGIFIDGTPFVLLAPTVFVDFMQAPDDYYQSYIYVNFIRIIRYISLYICMLAPAIYIALTTHHQDIIPTQLLLSLAAQREGVPFPAFVEALIMEITFEILREAGIRMPRTVGQTVSIVGTLVIGQAAVEAGVVSAVMVIIVAITAISSFVIPAYSMAIAIRLLRFIFMGLAAMLGMYGLTIGMIILVSHMCSLQSFGKPYMSPMAPYNKQGQGDAIFRFPFRSANHRE
jgi:spore germination protein KA